VNEQLQAPVQPEELNKAVVDLGDLVAFACQRGFHELGYDPLAVINSALAKRSTPYPAAAPVGLTLKGYRVTDPMSGNVMWAGIDGRPGVPYENDGYIVERLYTINERGASSPSKNSIREQYIKDLEDTFAQIAKLVRVEQDADKLIATIAQLVKMEDAISGPGPMDVHEGFKTYLASRGESFGNAGAGMYSFGAANKQADAFRAGADYAVKALRPDMKDAIRYRGWRDHMITQDPKFIDAMQDALPDAVGDGRAPTAEEWDRGIDAAVATTAK
jgi:hypothetical protein